jgi:crossover junction endodeoxyribonuclease RuvC
MSMEEIEAAQLAPERPLGNVTSSAGSSQPISEIRERAQGLVIGIDIGAVGALALVTYDGVLLDVADMPILRDGPAGRPTVNAALLSGIVAGWGAGAAYVEYVGARPGEGAVGAFAFGRAVEGVMAAHGLPIQFLTPPAWKRIIGIPPGRDGAKDAARSEAIRRWPHKAALFARAKDDGRAEAALIAVAGLLRTREAVR